MDDWRIVADGLRFPEGPVMMPDGSVIVVEIAAGEVTRIMPDGRKLTVARPGGGPNGLAFGPDGWLYCCNNGGFSWRESRGRLYPHGAAVDHAGGRIERIDPDSGKVEVLYADGDFGCSLRGPNDLVFDEAGGCWFSDHGHTHGRSRDVTGLFYAKADGSGCREAAFPLENPNGIGLSPDGTTIYAAETYTCRLLAFPLFQPGVIDPAAARGQVLYRPAGNAFFDSLGVEVEGNICVATVARGGISVISPAGELVEFVATPDPFTTNICWGGADRRDAYVTLSASGQLATRRWPRPGLALAY